MTSTASIRRVFAFLAPWILLVVVLSVGRDDTACERPVVRRERRPASASPRRAPLPAIEDELVPVRESREVAATAPEPQAPGRPAETERPEPIPAGRIQGLAIAVARELWGPEVRLRDVQPQTGPDGSPLSYLVVFSRGDLAETKEEILRELENGGDPNRWDDSLVGLEMGGTTEHPPVIAYWNGLPAEYLFRSVGKAQILREFGQDDYRYVRSHLSAVFPVLEFTNGVQSYYFNPRSGNVARRFEVSLNQEFRASPRHRERAERFRKQWSELLQSPD